jgi:hypothetical protein
MSSSKESGSMTKLMLEELQKKLLENEIPNLNEDENSVEKLTDEDIEKIRKKMYKLSQKIKKGEPRWRVGRTKPTLRARGIKNAVIRKRQKIARRKNRK